MKRISLLSKVNNCTFEGHNAISKFSSVVNSSLGFGTYISSYCRIFNCNIGRFCSIAQKVEIIFGDHPTSLFVSTHPCFYSKNNPVQIEFSNINSFEEYTFVDNEKKYFVEIGNDVWVGYGARILSGVKIADGAIIAAGSLVTKDVGPYEVVGGIPAKLIKRRFTDAEISKLLHIKWWEKDLSWIQAHSSDMANAKLFIDGIELENTSRET